MEHISVEQILRLLDNATTPAEQETIKKHLAACALCQHEMELQEAITWSMRSQPLTEPSAMFTDQVMAQIIPQRSARPLRSQWAGAAAVCFVVAIGYLFVTNMSNTAVSNVPSPHEQMLGSSYANSMNSFSDILTGGVHALTGYLASGSGKMFAGAIFSLSVLLLLDGILSRRFTALRR